MERGYVKLWRRSIDSDVFQNPGLWRVWTWCLMRSGWKKRSVPFRTGKGNLSVSLDPGQFLFGRKSAAESLGESPSTVWKRIKKLESIGCISVQSNSQYSIISICKWEEYQSEDEQKEQASDTQVTPKEHPSDTQVTPKEHKEEVKEVEEVEEEYTSPDEPDEEIATYKTKKGKTLKNRVLSDFNLFWDSFGYMKGKADAADAFLNVYSPAVFDDIISGAKNEAENREGFKAKGGTPKMAQGWLSGRRWEDEKTEKENSQWE